MSGARSVSSYRSLVPLAFLLLLVEQAGRALLKLYWPVERSSSTAGAWINNVFLAVIVPGLVLSFWRTRTLNQVA